MTKTIEEAFAHERWEAERKYRNALAEIERWRGEVLQILVDVKEQGLVLLNHADTIKPIKARFDIDLYALLRAQAERLRRPYVQCVRTSHIRIMVRLTSSGPQRALLAPLLLFAQPLKMHTRTVKRRRTGQREEVKVLPNFLEDEDIAWSGDAPVRHWVTGATITILFEGYEGEKAFDTWRNNVLNDNLQRMLLGIGVKK